MKRILLAILQLSVLFCTLSCEKTYLGEDREEPPEDVVEGEAGDGTGDNGGWYGEGSDVDDDVVYLGDTVDVGTFRSHVIYGQIWVKGYIVGAATGAYGKRRYEFGPDFNYDTAILIADDPGVVDEEETVPISLTTCSKAIRSKLNLVDNPGNKGVFIWVYGVQETYLGLPGIKHIDGLEPLELLR